MVKLKDAFKEVIAKQVDRIAEIMTFKNPEQEKALRQIINANLLRSISRTNAMTDKVVTDARESKLYKFAVALRASKNEKEFIANIQKAFPDNSKTFYRTLMKRYNDIFLGTINYHFPVTFAMSTKQKEEKNQKPEPVNEQSVEALSLVCQQVDELTRKVLKLESDFEIAKQHIAILRKRMAEHSHNRDGKSIMVTPI